MSKEAKFINPTEPKQQLNPYPEEMTRVCCFIAEWLGIPVGELAEIKDDYKKLGLNPISRLCGSGTRHTIEKAVHKTTFQKEDVDFQPIFQAMKKGLKNKPEDETRKKLKNNLNQFQKTNIQALGEMYYGRLDEELVEISGIITEALGIKVISLNTGERSFSSPSLSLELKLRIINCAFKLGKERNKKEPGNKYWYQQIILPVKNGLENDFKEKLNLSDYWENIRKNLPFSSVNEEARKKGRKRKFKKGKIRGKSKGPKLN